MKNEKKEKIENLRFVFIIISIFFGFFFGYDLYFSSIIVVLIFIVTSSSLLTIGVILYIEKEDKSKVHLYFLQSATLFFISLYGGMLVGEVSHISERIVVGFPAAVLLFIALEICSFIANKKMKKYLKKESVFPPIRIIFSSFFLGIFISYFFIIWILYLYIFFSGSGEVELNHLISLVLTTVLLSSFLFQFIYKKTFYEFRLSEKAKKDSHFVDDNIEVQIPTKGERELPQDVSPKLQRLLQEKEKWREKLEFYKKDLKDGILSNEEYQKKYEEIMDKLVDIEDKIIQEKMKKGGRK